MSFNQFVSFFYFMNEFGEHKEELFKGDKKITPKELLQIANNIIDKCPDRKRKCRLEERHLDVFFQILDSNSIFIINIFLIEDGQLEKSEIKNWIKRRNFYSQGKSDVLR